MQDALAPAIDMLLIILTFFVKVGLLRSVLRMVAKHQADTGFFKAVIVTGMIAGLYGVLSFMLRDPLGPVALAATFVVAFLLVRFLCWLTSRKALYVALIYSTLLIGVSFGTMKAADWVKPDRVTFLEASANAKEELSRMRVSEGKPIDWEWLFATALDAIAQLTRPGEVDRMNADIERGMEVYRERRQQIDALASGSLTDGQPTALDALSTLATGEVDDAMFSSVMLSDLAYGATSTPPAYISEALAQISSNLTGEGGMEALAALMATGSVTTAALMQDAAASDGRRTEAQDSRAMLIAATKSIMQNMGVIEGASLTNAAIVDEVAGQLGHFGKLVAAKQLASLQAPVAPVAPPKDITTAEPGAPTVAEAHPPPVQVATTTVTRASSGVRGNADVARLGGSLVPESKLAPGSGVEVHPSYALLKVDGVMRGAGGRKMILCNGKIISEGRSVTVDLNGTNFTWRLEAVRNGVPVWRRLARTGSDGVLAL
ncbi:MAG: hypothetical protein HN919_02040 [Verrucomicrobia bacterium]|jgi:hypothetical protein|nr:hypothetical protein [Verrucomicrobiota bacterium]MBT7065059.1 hypothetical protein [Verrucomicrobiota bacterium]MBT7699586.1 hypothetical protein [Verrucomicrobiota bacterium]